MIVALPGLSLTFFLYVFYTCPDRLCLFNANNDLHPFYNLFIVIIIVFTFVCLFFVFVFFYFFIINIILESL